MLVSRRVNDLESSGLAKLRHSSLASIQWLKKGVPWLLRFQWCFQDSCCWVCQGWRETRPGRSQREWKRMVAAECGKSSTKAVALSCCLILFNLILPGFIYAIRKYRKKQKPAKSTHFLWIFPRSFRTPLILKGNKSMITQDWSPFYSCPFFICSVL